MHASCYNGKAMIDNPEFIQVTHIENKIEGAESAPEPEFFGRIAQNPLGLHVIRNALTGAGVTHIRLLTTPDSWALPYIPNATIVNMNTTAGEIAERLEGTQFSALADKRLKMPIASVEYEYQGELRKPQKGVPQSRAVVRAQLGQVAADRLIAEATAMRKILGLPQGPSQVKRVRWFDVAEINGPTHILQAKQTGSALAGLATRVMQKTCVFGKLGIHTLNSPSKPNQNLL